MNTVRNFPKLAVQVNTVDIDKSPLLVRLFNVIFDSGNFPSIWTEGIIIPLLKKGHANDANNYRGITLISCLEKIFTSVINNRLLKWSNENSIVTDAQFGFKPGYGTTDAIFSLHTVISKVYQAKRSYIAVLWIIAKHLTV